MAITIFRRTEPFGLLRNFDRDIDCWFDEDWLGLDIRRNSVFSEFMDRTWTPAVDIEEKDGKYIIRVDLPGTRKEDIHVELKDGYLNLRGERSIEKEDKKIITGSSGFTVFLSGHSACRTVLRRRISTPVSRTACLS